MRRYLALSVTFLLPVYHGRRSEDEAEWPPSPLRLFQALVCSEKRRATPAEFCATVRPALEWLTRSAPVIDAPATTPGQHFRLSVPNNDMDVIARAHAAGQLPSREPAQLRTMKTVRPTHLRGSTRVNFLWELPAEDTDPAHGHARTLAAAARHVVALGWGIDLVAGDGRVVSEREVKRLSGERWEPSALPGGQRARLPTSTTLAELEARHQAFLTPVSEDGALTQAPPLAAFREVWYRRDTDPAIRPAAAFQFLDPQAERLRSFPSRHVVRVAGMMRHAVAEVARTARRPADWIATFVLGHGPDGRATGPADLPRFAFLPLPTIDPRGVVSAVRRILVAEPPGGAGRETTWVRRFLSGQELVDEETGRPVAMLGPLPASDGVVRQYLGLQQGASTWSTVTPVILPGYDDRSAAKTERLLRRAIEQAGYSEALARGADLEWRHVGFRPGLDLASRYAGPAYLAGFPRCHVRLTWRDAAGQPVAMQGPVCLGAGRYCGLGLFAAERDAL